MNENIIVFGFEEELDFIESIVPWKGTAIIDTDCPTDLIAVGCYASITNLSRIKDEGLQILYDYYLSVLDPAEVPIFIGTPKLPIPKELVNVIALYESMEKAKGKLKYDLLAAYRKQKKSVTFSRTISNALVVLTQIRKHPGITTEKLSAILELSTRTIQRYIESLRIAGEWILYDSSMKGWKLMDGKSILFGEPENLPPYSAFDAKWFFRKYTEKITWEKYAEAYRHDSEFTPLVTAAINEIIEDGTGWQHQNEYFRIDIVGWESHYETIKPEANEARLNAHLWNLEIAVEHENNKQDWTDELIKLMQIRCPLKVIIGYNYYDDREENECRKLGIAAKMLQATDAYQSIARDQEEILLILGNGCSRKTGRSDYTSFDYRGYLYDFASESFIQLQK